MYRQPKPTNNRQFCSSVISDSVNLSKELLFAKIWLTQKMSTEKFWLLLQKDLLWDGWVWASCIYNIYGLKRQWQPKTTLRTWNELLWAYVYGQEEAHGYNCLIVFSHCTFKKRESQHLLLVNMRYTLVCQTSTFILTWPQTCRLLPHQDHQKLTIRKLVSMAKLWDQSEVVVWHRVSGLY